MLLCGGCDCHMPAINSAPVRFAAPLSLQAGLSGLTALHVNCQGALVFETHVRALSRDR